MILIVNALEGTSKGLDGLRLKYRFGQDEPSHRYRTLLLQILEAVAAALRTLPASGRRLDAVIVRNDDPAPQGECGSGVVGD